MSQQLRHSVPRAARGLAAFVSTLCLLAVPAAAGDINACKYLVVQDFTSDPYGIAQELRAQASAKGFALVSAISEVPQADLLKTCVMGGSWARDAGGGELSLRVVNAPSGALVAEAAAQAGRIGVTRTVGYTGYNEEVFQEWIQREYPTRPKFGITEAEIKKKEPGTPVEGIWSDTEDKYRLGIVRASGGSSADYIVVILQSNSPLWQPGEIKAEIHATASPDVFTCTYFLANKKPAGMTLTLDHDSVLRGSFATAKGSVDLMLMRVWPSVAEAHGSAESTSVASGTGFLLSRSGLLATNWHVVANANNITVVFPGWGSSATAQLVIRDVANDLAVLRVTDSTRLAATCPEPPFQLASASRVKLGERVSTIGYPLTPMLGSNPKFSEGVVSSKSGWQDDPRTLQISAQVQPGSSGGPLFDDDGNIVGIVVATLDVGKVYELANALPQNVNFAIKADYLLSLVASLPGDSLVSRTTAFSPEKAAQCVGILRAWSGPSVAANETHPSGSVTKLSLASSPSGAEVEVDGNFVGTTPSTIEVSPGDHTIVVEKRGFAVWERKAKLLGGDVRISAELEQSAQAPTETATVLTSTKSQPTTQVATSRASATPLAPVVTPASAPASGNDSLDQEPVAVAVISDPPEADLFVDSKGFGQTPKQFQLAPGSHSIQVVKQGYKDWATKLLVEAGAPTTVKAKLEK
jgi:S1-C subfamily serine protease